MIVFGTLRDSSERYVKSTMPIKEGEKRMISRVLSLRLFEAFSIQRWNDRIRPVEMSEMDKQAFKTVLAYFFAKFEEANGKKIDWDYIIYGSLFALLKNIALSDIKAPVIKKMKQDHKEAYKNLNSWVVDSYRSIIDDKDLLEKFENFLNNNDSDENNLNLKILRAAHKYSTLREFEILKPFNTSFPRLKELEREVNRDLKKFVDLEGVKEIFIEQQDLYEAICLIEQLRFQTRWSQTPRIPKTSVLGHSMFVACLMIFFSRELKACNKRLYNNFFAGLFHDLPEAVVRDIISPVKRATTELPDIVKKIESEMCQTELYSKFPSFILEDIQYLIGDNLESGDEFSNRIIDEKKARVLSSDENISVYNLDKYSPVDGKLIKVADEITAFIEAEQSIKHGITSYHLQDGMANIRIKYMKENTIGDIIVQKFFLEFN